MNAVGLDGSKPLLPQVQNAAADAVNVSLLLSKRHQYLTCVLVYHRRQPEPSSCLNFRICSGIFA